MKKLLALIACFSLLLSCCIVGTGAIASAAEYEVSPEADFIAFDGVIEEYIGPGGDVVIPATIDGEPLTEIGANAFANNNDISTVVIPEGVEKIGHRAFYQCSNLYAVEFPYSLYEFGSETFTNCALEKVTVPGGVAKVAYNTFGDIECLKEINISYGVEEIHKNAFGLCSPKRVVFPETVKFIAGGAFCYLQTQDSVEFVICNPDISLGARVVKGGLWQAMMNGNWSDEIYAPWNSTLGAGTTAFRVVVPEGSKTSEFIKGWKDNGLSILENEEEINKNTYRIVEEDEEYFKNLKENQKDWGVVKTRTDIPNSYSSSGGTNSDTDDTNDLGDANEPDNKNTNSGNKNNNSNNNDGGTQTIVEDGGDNANLYIILGAIGGLFVLIIAGVVIFATVMLKGGKKAASASVPTASAEKATDENPAE